jgi:LCP family protein required for cell wall assembly
VLLAFLGAALVLLTGLVGFRAWSVLQAIAPGARPGDVISLVHPPPPQPGSLAWKIQHDQRINILLLGYGGPGHQGAYLTDSIMMVSIRPGSKQAIMVSIPRDLWVKIPALPAGGVMWGKINSAYTIGIDRSNYPNVRAQWKTPTGGGDLAAATVGQVTGQHVDAWMAVDFKAFRDVVDALGGVEVTVPKALDDPYYPKGEHGGYKHIHFNAGRQFMNGEQALEYARSRETTNDFDRSARQQLIMVAVRQRVLTLGAMPKLFGLMGALQDNVRTNLRPGDMRQLAALFGDKSWLIGHAGIDNTNFLRNTFSPDGQYILLPRDESYATLQHFLASALPDRSLLKAAIPFQVMDGSRSYSLPWPMTPARVVTPLLANLGWKATVGPAGKSRARTTIFDGSAGSATDTVNWLKAFFDADVVTTPAPATGPAVSVVLGTDFTLRAFP